MNRATTAFRSALASHPTLSALRWGAGEDPMSKAVWYTAADPSSGLVLVVCPPLPDAWLGAPHDWTWTVFDRAASRPGPAAESAGGCATADAAVEGLGAALELLAATRWDVPARV